MDGRIHHICLHLQPVPAECRTRSLNPVDQDSPHPAYGRCVSGEILRAQGVADNTALRRSHVTAGQLFKYTQRSMGRATDLMSPRTTTQSRGITARSTRFDRDHFRQIASGVIVGWYSSSLTKTVEKPLLADDNWTDDVR